MLDLLIINGHVIDPANGVDEVRPVRYIMGRSLIMRRANRRGM